MSKSKKIALGIATIWLPVYIVFFIVFMFSVSFLYSGQSNETPIWFLLIFPLHFLSIILSFALLVIYIMNLFKNDRVAQNNRVLWLILLLVGGFIPMLIYWYLYIWKEPIQQLPEKKV